MHIQIAEKQYLYILQPHSAWTYCGGLACVSACSFAEVVQTCREYEQQEEARYRKRLNRPDYRFELFKEIQEVELEQGSHSVWVVKMKIEIVGSAPRGILAVDYDS